MICIRFESIGFNCEEYKEFKQLVAALEAGKCPVVSVPTSYWNPSSKGSHAMVATGIKNKRAIQFIQLKNSHADNPDEPGKFNEISFNEPALSVKEILIYFLALVICLNVFEWWKDVIDLPYNDTLALEMFYIDFQFNIADPPVFQQKGFTIDALRFWIIYIRKSLKQLSTLFNLSEDLKNALNQMQND